MKKLLKSIICKICEQYIRVLFTVIKSNVAGEKRKKKRTKRERTNANVAFSPIQTDTIYK